MSSEINASTGAGSGVAASPPRENLYRATSDIGLLRSMADKDAMPTLRGHFAVWNQWTEIRSAYEGHFLERFAPGAMTKTLSESTPKVLFQHGRDPQIGDKPLGPITRVQPDDTGAYYEVPLLDTTYNRDLLPGLEAGLYGASFRFSVVQEDVVKKPARSETNPMGLPERTVTEARVMEFGPVTFPAYAGATAGVRSMTDEFSLSLPGFAHSHAYSAPLPTVSFAGTGSPEFWVRLTGAPETTTTTSSAEADDRATEPEPQVEAEVRNEPEPEATTPEAEPEPEATTRSSRGLFWFADDPSTKGAK